MPEISIIVPVYNVEKYLHQCINSVLAQTFEDFELILVDDGSPDNCGVICDEYAKQDKRVHVLHQKNQGVSVARNVGIEWALSNSDSEWLCFVDSDDFVHPDYLKALYAAVKKYDIKLSQCASFDFFDGEEFDVQPIESYVNRLVTPEKVYIMRGTVVPMRKLIHRDLMKEVRFPVGKSMEDEYTIYKVIFSVKHIAIIDQALYYYRIRAGSAMHSSWSLKRFDAFDAYEQQIAFFHESRYDELYVMTIRKYVNDVICQYIECCKTDFEEKEKALEFLKKRMRSVLKRYQKAGHITFRDFTGAYEVAYPQLMWLYWSIKAKINKIKGR